MLKGSRRIKKLQALSLDPTVDLWAMDEVHFQQHGSRCRMWVPPETKDPVLLHHPTRKSVGYFGAVRVRDGKFFFRRETGKFNAVTCWEFLKDLHAISTRAPRRVVVIATTPNTTMRGCTGTGGRKGPSVSPSTSCRLTVRN